MRFEQFHGTGDRGKHASDGLKEVRVSEATRSMAREPGVRFASFDEEWAWLLAEKGRLEAALTGYSKAAFSKAQLAVRKQYYGNDGKSLRAWLETRARMDSERRKLVEEKAEIERRMSQIKSRVVAERERNREEQKKALRKERTNRIDYGALGQEILNELRAIRCLLEDGLSGSRGTESAADRPMDGANTHG